MFLIAGLGNPDKKYEKTRHNIGFDVIDALAAQYNISMTEKRHKALCGLGTIEGIKVLLAKPQTYMNRSGESVSEIISYYKLDPEREMLVMFDDISLQPGSIRVRKKGSAGGHNGIKDIISKTGTQNFMRIKVGVGDKPSGWDLAAHVLGRFSDEDRAKVEEAIADAKAAAVLMLQGQADRAMNDFNGKKQG